MKLSRDTRGSFVALSLVGAGLIHLAAIRSHVGSAAAVSAFVIVGLAQVFLGVSFLFAGRPGAKRAAVALIGVASIGAWLISRTAGLPSISGHTGPEQIGLPDLAAALLQLAALVIALSPPRASMTVRPHLVGRIAFALPIVAVSAFASVSLLSIPEHAHSHEPVRAAQVESSAPRTNGVLVKRAVPQPAVESKPVEPDHVDAPGTAAHSH